MHRSKALLRVFSSFATIALLAGAQFAIAKDSPLQRQKIYANAKGLVSPSLIPAHLTTAPAQNCDGDYNGSIQFSLIIDTEGKPRNIFFEKPTGSKLDVLALEVVEADRFVPGSLEGKPVAVSQSVNVTLHACLVNGASREEKLNLTLNLQSQPQQTFSDSNQFVSEIALNPSSIALDAKHTIAQFSGKVSPPVAFVPLEPIYLKKDSRIRREGTAIVEMVVDEHGLPQNARIIQSFDAGMDSKALEAVAMQRFRPAMSDGRPVPGKIAEQFQFRLYRQE